MGPRRAAVAVVALLAAGAATADTVYKCEAGGRTIYQQTPCAKNQRQQTIRLQDPAPAAERPAPAPSPSPAAADAEPLPPPPSNAPPPTLFGCIRATDGKPYTSPDGRTEPYMAPLGVLGAISQPLADTYGNRGSAVASAPELNRGKGNVAAITNSNYVWVQDECRPLSPAEACAALRDDAEANQRSIRHAFKSERGPLEAKDAQLRKQLQGCR